MIFNKIPQIKLFNLHISRILFALFNLFFSLRLIWVLLASNLNRSSIKLLIMVIVVQILLAVAGSIRKLFSLLTWPLLITGGPLLLYFVFIISKRFLKPILESQPDGIQVEVGAWFFGLFLVLALIILLSFLWDLTRRALDAVSRQRTNDPKARLLAAGHLVIILILIGYWIYTQFINPLPIYSNYDPEFTYLMNSLTPFKDFELYVRMDHPGTFLQLAGSLIAVLLSPISLIKQGYPYQYHIFHPEAFILTARLILLLLNIAVVRLIYRFFRYPGSWSETFAGLGAMIIYFAAHQDAFEFLTIWSPNSFSFAAGTSLLIMLYAFTTSGKYKDPLSLWMISLAVGLAATFHIYLITMILCLVAVVFLTSVFEKNSWLETIKLSSLSAVGAAAGYFTATLVILRYYQSLFAWVIDVATHQGIYGGGSIGFADLEEWIFNLGRLWRYNESLFIVWLVSILGLAWVFTLQKRKNELIPSIWAFLLGIYLQFFILMVLFGKHPGHRYLLSISALLPILLLAVSGLVGSQARSMTLLFGIILAGLTGLFFTKLDQNLADHLDRIGYLDQYQTEVKQFRKQVQDQAGLDPDDITVYWTYNTWSPCYARWLGNEFSKNRFTDQVLEICPRDLQFDIWNKSITNPRNLKDPGELNILIVNQRNFDQVQKMEYLTKIESSVSNLGFILIDRAQP